MRSITQAGLWNSRPYSAHIFSRHFSTDYAKGEQKTNSLRAQIRRPEEGSSGNKAAL
jgi:hypothetical protein